MTTPQLSAPFCGSLRIPALPENALQTIIEMDLWVRLEDDPLGADYFAVKRFKARALQLFSVSKIFYVRHIYL